MLLAAEASTAVTVLTETATKVGTQMNDTVMAVIPIITGVLALVVAVKFGVRFIKGLTGSIS